MIAQILYESFTFINRDLNLAIGERYELLKLNAKEYLIGVK